MPHKKFHKPGYTTLHFGDGPIMGDLPAMTYELAYHEAGHAIMAHLFGYPLSEIRVYADEDTYEGHASYGDATDQRPARQLLEEDIIISCAGDVAMRLYAECDTLDWRDSCDYHHILWKLAKHCDGPDEIDHYIVYCRDRAEDILSKPGVWFAVEYIAELLVQTQEESGYWKDGEDIIDYEAEYTHFIEGYEIIKYIDDALLLCAKLEALGKL